MSQDNSQGWDDPSIIRPQVTTTDFSKLPSSRNMDTAAEEDDILSDVVEEIGTIVEPVVKSEDIVDIPEKAPEEPTEETLDVNLDDDEFVDERNPDRVMFSEDKIDLRGESLEDIVELIKVNEELIGRDAIDARTRTVGTWENNVFRTATDQNFEEIRIQNALADILSQDGTKPTSILRDAESGKILLRTSSISGKGPSAGEVRNVTGDEALLAFENIKSRKGGGYRITLYNSGITVDVVVPTGTDVQTMLTNCIMMDRQLGSSQGAHYFTYSDQMYKAQALSFIYPLIVNSSYTDWRKKGKLWTVMKFPDLQALIMSIAAICYKEGFDGFVHRCSRPRSEEHPDLCRHTETFTANLFDMIVTRFSVINKECIDFLVQARLGRNKNNLTQIAKYQADLGLEGERLTFGDITYVMRIPTIAEHLDDGATFLADIMNEIEADNNDSHYREVVYRYIRTFLPWIASIETTTAEGGTIRTSDRRTIVRELEKFDKDDVDDVMRKGFRDYVNKTQLTYVGYPVTPCNGCGYVADTPSGMYTFDPFSAFFTLAFQYLKPKT